MPVRLARYDREEKIDGTTQIRVSTEVYELLLAEKRRLKSLGTGASIANLASNIIFDCLSKPRTDTIITLPVTAVIPNCGQVGVDHYAPVRYDTTSEEHSAPPQAPAADWPRLITPEEAVRPLNLAPEAINHPKTV